MAAFSGHGHGLTMDVVDVWRKQVELPDLVAQLIETQRRWNAPVGIEANGVGAAVPQFLKRAQLGSRIYELRSTVDKLTRSIPASTAYAAGRLRFPPQAHWLGVVLQELRAFTGTGVEPHDDIADAITHCWLTGYAVTHGHLLQTRKQTIARSLPFG